MEIRCFVSLCTQYDYFFPEFATESEAFPEWSDRETGDGEAEMGDGVQGLLGICGRIHEHAGTVLVSKQINSTCSCST